MKVVAIAFNYEHCVTKAGKLQKRLEMIFDILHKNAEFLTSGNGGPISGWPVTPDAVFDLKTNLEEP